MTDHPMHDSFEQRISAELERYVVDAWDPTPAVEIAERAMRPRGLAQRTRNASRSRRLLLLGVAALLLVPAAYAGANLFRPPAPTLLNQLSPPQTANPRPTEPQATPGLTDGYRAIFLRREAGADPGVSIFGVRPDGGEVLLRQLSDSLAPDGASWSRWGSVSESGWLALSVEKFGGPWPLVLVDLRDPESEAWFVAGANLGAVGPRWGPTGLLAAPAGDGISNILLVDPEARTTRPFDLQGTRLVGGGPSIVWTTDGDIVGDAQTGYDTLPINGAGRIRGVGDVYGNGGWGPGMDTLRICSPDVLCAAGGAGRVERVDADGLSAETIWQPKGTERPLTAHFGEDDGEYWLTLDIDAGRQVRIVRIQASVETEAATVNRSADWQSLGFWQEAPDESAIALGATIDDVLAVVLAPLSDLPQSFHGGHFAGFVDGAALAFATGDYRAPAATMPPVGEAYRLPTVDELIAAELALNPTERVLARGSRDGVEGQTERETHEVVAGGSGPGMVYVDCLGPAELRVSLSDDEVVNPCLAPGSHGLALNLRAGDVLEVDATGDTTWRVVFYGCENCSVP